MIIKTSKLLKEFLIKQKTFLVFMTDLALLSASLAFFHICFEHEFYEKLFPEIESYKVVFLSLIIPGLYFSVTYISGLYSFDLKRFDQVFLVVITQSVLFSSLGFFSYWFKLPLGRDVLLFCFIFNVLLVYLSRLILKNFFTPNESFFLKKINCLILGKTKFSEKLIKTKRFYEIYNFEILELEQSKKKLIQKLKLKELDLLILSSNSYEIDSEVIRELVSLRFSGKRILNIGSFYEDFLKKVPIDYLEQNWFIDQKVSRQISDQIFLRFKRIFDLFLALFISPAALVLVIFGIFLIKISSKGPAIFKQIRVGQNNQKFVIYKLRTMSFEPNSIQNPKADWTQKKDPRITSVGKFLRKMRIDELPQLVNIFKGEMSFIGPRPERPELASQLRQEIPFYDLRLAIKPGLSGWAQVIKPLATPSKEDTLDKVSLDLYYIRNLSLRLEIEIMLLTVRVILSRKAL